MIEAERKRKKKNVEGTKTRQRECITQTEKRARAKMHTESRMFTYVKWNRKRNKTEKKQKRGTQQRRAMWRNKEKLNNKRKKREDNKREISKSWEKKRSNNVRIGLRWPGSVLLEQSLAYTLVRRTSINRSNDFFYFFVFNTRINKTREKSKVKW